MDANQSEKKKRKAKMVWSEEMKLELLKNLERFGKQSGAEGGYKSSTWNAVLVAMQKAFPKSNIEKDQLHSQHQNLKSKFSVFRKLKDNVGTSGWGYDPETDMITTSNEAFTVSICCHIR
jgi:hypothetical protein